MSIVVKDGTREKVSAKVKRLHDDIVKKNLAARKAKIDDDNRLIRDKREERQHWFEQSCKRMQGSALAIDQDAYEMIRRSRSSEHERQVLVRRNRNAVLSGSTQILLKPASFPRGEALYVGPNAVSDYVDPHKVTVAMSSQLKYSKEALEIVEREKRNIDKMLAREIQEMFNQFPKVISIVSKMRREKYEKNQSRDFTPNESLRSLSDMPSSSAEPQMHLSVTGAPPSGPRTVWNSPHSPQEKLDSPDVLSQVISPFPSQWNKTEVKARTRPGSRIVYRSAPTSSTVRSMSSRFDSSAVPLNLSRPVLPPLLAQDRR